MTQPQEPNKCCERCRVLESMTMELYSCSNDDCPCHKAPVAPAECGEHVGKGAYGNPCILPTGHEGEHTHAQEKGEAWADIDGMLKTFKTYNGTDFCALCGLDPKKLREGIREAIQQARRAELIEHIAIIDTKLKNDPNNPVLIAGLLYWKTVCETRLQALHPTNK